MARIHGIVERMQVRKQYFFIVSKGERNQVLEYYGDFRQVQRDLIGRRNLDIGMPVSFVAGTPPVAGQLQPALEIQNEDPALAEIDPVAHREWGQVLSFDGRHGYIQRGAADGKDSINFYADDVISEGARSIKTGDWLYFGIQQRERAKGGFAHSRWFAVEIQTAATDVPPEEVEPPPDAEQVYSESDRTKTIRELIFRK